MLKAGKIIIYTALLAFACTDSSDKDLAASSLETIGEKEYNFIYKQAKDSLDTWSINNLGLYSDDKKNYEFLLDSLLCFNQDATRFVTCILEKIKGPISSDGIKYFYGEKISGQWYFFGGASIVIPRKMFPDHPLNEPLSYQQLHEAALKEVYSGYANSSGKINEEWFIQHFEGPGWGLFDNQSAFDWFLKGKRFTNKKEYFEYVHKQAALDIWANRDTTQPIKRLNKSHPLP